MWSNYVDATLPWVYLWTGFLTALIALLMLFSSLSTGKQ